jgi:hypothetical protein
MTRTLPALLGIRRPNLTQTTGPSPRSIGKHRSRAARLPTPRSAVGTWPLRQSSDLALGRARAREPQACFGRRGQELMGHCYSLSLRRLRRDRDQV